MISFGDMCKRVGRSPVVVRSIQNALELPMADTYSDGYARFMGKVVALRIMGFPFEDIHDLLETEKKIMRLLHIDSLNATPTWYLDAPNGNGSSDRCLLLTGHDLGFPVDSPVVQGTLDFSATGPELFKGAEMGEDLNRILQNYRAELRALKKRICQEIPVLERTLDWSHWLAEKLPC